MLYLIAPSLYHRIASGGETFQNTLGAATFFAGWSLLPLTLGLGASAYVIFARFAGSEIAWIFAAALTLTGLSLLYEVGFSMRRPRKPLPPKSPTPLKTKIEQLLTEARVIIPGGQALLGFQFVATLTKAFDNLPDWMKWIHAAALAAVAISVLLLMTPAALHRLAFHGNDDPEFFAIGSKLVIAAALPLALGISANIAVVTYKITERTGFALSAAAAAAAMFLSVWYVYSLAVKHR